MKYLQLIVESPFVYVRIILIASVSFGDSSMLATNSAHNIFQIFGDFS